MINNDLRKSTLRTCYAFFLMLLSLYDVDVKKLLYIHIL